MTDHDRGAYTPQTDAPLAFDARQPAGRSGGSPTTLIVSGVILVALVGAVALFYRGGVRAPNTPPPVVGEPVGAMKGPPPASAQPAPPEPQPDIYNSGQPAPAAPTFAAGPEQPMPRPTPQPTLRVQTGELPAVTEAPGPPPPAAPKAAPKPAPTPAPAAPVVAQPKPAPTPAPAASGPAVVQIGAFKSEALAGTEWGKVAMDFPSDMAGKGRRVEAVQSNGATLYRGQITGFASREAASAFCAKLKGSGRSCIVK